MAPATGRERQADHGSDGQCQERAAGVGEQAGEREQAEEPELEQAAARW